MSGRAEVNRFFFSICELRCIDDRKCHTVPQVSDMKCVMLVAFILDMTP